MSTHVVLYFGRVIHGVHDGLGYPRVQRSQQVLQTHRRLPVVDGRHQPIDGLVIAGPRRVQMSGLPGQTTPDHVDAQPVTRFRVSAGAPRALSHFGQRGNALVPVSVAQPRLGVIFVHQLTAVSVCTGENNTRFNKDAAIIILLIIIMRFHTSTVTNNDNNYLRACTKPLVAVNVLAMSLANAVGTSPKGFTSNALAVRHCAYSSSNRAAVLSCLSSDAAATATVR